MPKAPAKRASPSPSLDFPNVQAWRVVIFLAAYGLVFALLFRLGFLVQGSGIYSLWYPAAGLRFAVLLYFGPRVWVCLLPIELAVEIGSGAWVFWGSDAALLMLLGMSAPTATYALTLAILNRYRRLEISLEPYANLIFATIAALAAAILSSLASASTLVLAGQLQPESVWAAVLSACTGDLVGIATIAPICLAGLTALDERSLPEIGWRFAIEAAISMAVAAGLLGLLGAGSQFLEWYPALLPVLWLALRYGWTGAVVAVLCVNIASALAAGLLPSAQARFELQMFMLMQSVTGLLLGGLTSARQLALERLRRQRAAMLHLDRLSHLGQLAAELTHEITQPLAAIATYARAGRRSAGEDRAGEALDLISQEANRLMEIVRRTRALSQNKPPVMAEIDLTEALTELRPLLKLETERANVVLECHAQENCPTVLADTVQMQQIVLNLVRNAIDAMADTPAESRRIVLKIAPERHDRVMLSMTDTGAGFQDEGDVKRMFAPFVSSSLEGNGLGLAISRRIVEAHGGRIWAEQPDSGGTRICVLLPVDGKAVKHP